MPMSMQSPSYVQPPQPPSTKKGPSAGLIITVVVGVFMVGVIALVALYRFRLAEAAARTSEAKDTVMRIARAGVGAYWRENRLCESSTRVPTTPHAQKYVASSDDVVDFNTGDATTGWKCLRLGGATFMQAARRDPNASLDEGGRDLNGKIEVATSKGLYYAPQYEKGAGSGKSGATPNGFEASAMGDRDGNGVYSFFGLGADVQNDRVIVNNHMLVENEFE
jgi:type IV pilus assembly protein PilA